MMLRRIVPHGWKLRVRLARRAWSDFRSGAARRFAQKSGRADRARYIHSIALTQPVLNATTEQSRINKIHNIRTASSSIEAVEIRPGEIFSFWRSVGRPSQKNNFKEGINIIGGAVIEDFGGGLCQLSSIIYHVSLMAGLAIVERSNHSVDLYHDRERSTPRGADCAVFYGYKDLRLRNDYDHPVRFRFDVQDRELTCFIESAEALAEKDIRFETILEDAAGFVVVTKDADEIIAESRYQKSKVAPAAEPPIVESRRSDESLGRLSAPPVF